MTTTTTAGDVAWGLQIRVHAACEAAPHARPQCRCIAGEHAHAAPPLLECCWCRGLIPAGTAPARTVDRGLPVHPGDCKAFADEHEGVYVAARARAAAVSSYYRCATRIRGERCTLAAVDGGQYCRLHTVRRPA